MDMEAFFKLHRDMPREGVGSDELTREALRRLPQLPPKPRILDIGCGPGKQTLVLARHFQTPIIAIDFHEPFLDQLRHSAESQGLSHLVDARLGRMEELDEQPGSVDLIWCEGAIFIVGFGEGLSLWRPLLRDGGWLVVSDAAWLKEDQPADVKKFWEAYPSMATVERNLQIAAERGYEVIDHFKLPQSAWWDEYCTPLSERVARLRPQAENDAALREILDDADREFDMFARHHDVYAYMFYLMRKTA